MKTGEIIKRIRMARGITQAQLAEMLGVGQSRISMLEKSEDVNFSTISKITSICGMELHIGAKFNFEKTELVF